MRLARRPTAALVTVSYAFSELCTGAMPTLVVGMLRWNERHAHGERGHGTRHLPGVASYTKEIDAVSEMPLETGEDLAAVATTDDRPVVLNPSEEPCALEECAYCGHSPCGCGG